MLNTALKTEETSLLNGIPTYLPTIEVVLVILF